MYKKRLNVPLFITIIGIITSLIYLIVAGYIESIVIEGGKEMSIYGCIAIVVALLGVAGGIWAQFVQFKKDANHITRVEGAVHDIKSDTGDSKPRVANIERGVYKIDERMISLDKSISREILPNLPKLDGIDVIVKDVEYRKLLQAEVKNDGLSMGYILAAVKEVYIDNVECKNVLKGEKERYMILEDKYIQRNQTIRDLTNENIGLKKQLNDIKSLQQDDDFEQEH